MEFGKAYTEVGEANKQFPKVKFLSCLKEQIRISKVHISFD
jgi:hypothetical protein